MQCLKYIISTIGLFLFSSAFSGATPKLFTLKKEDQIIYLFGSVHVGAPELYPLPDYVMTRFEQSDALAVEIDFTDTLSVAAGYATKQMRSVLTGDQRLSDYMSQDEINKIVDITAKPINLQLNPTAYLFPLLSAMIEETSLSANHGVDVYMINKALEKEMRIIGLERISEQFAIFFDMPLNDQAKMLKFTLDDWESQKRGLEIMFNFWAKGEDELFRYAFSELEKQSPSPAFIDNMIFKRNKKMAEKLIKKQSVGINRIFCTIGALHIEGERSVREYLLNAGYKLTETYPKKH